MNKISLIDTHAHYNNTCMPNLTEQIMIANANEDVAKIINVGLDLNTSHDAIKIAIENPKFYSTIGIHPLYNGNTKYLRHLYDTYENGKIVAVGETGIDTSDDITIQMKKMIESINLANQLHLPVIIHSNTTRDSFVNANQLCIEIIKCCPPEYGFVFHCFQPDLDVLTEIINLGGYISLASKITQANAKKSLEVIKETPIDKLLIETDYPFLADNPNEKGKATFDKMCEIKEQGKSPMMKQLNNNAKSLFKKLNNN